MAREKAVQRLDTTSMASSKSPKKSSVPRITIKKRALPVSTRTLRARVIRNKTVDKGEEDEKKQSEKEDKKISKPLINEQRTTSLQTPPAISEQDQFLNLPNLTWGEVAKQCQETGIPLADAIIERYHDPRDYDYHHIMDDTTALDENPDKYEKAFASLDAAKQLHQSKQSAIQNALTSAMTEESSKKRKSTAVTAGDQRLRNGPVKKASDKARKGAAQSSLRDKYPHVMKQNRLKQISTEAKGYNEYIQAELDSLEVAGSRVAASLNLSRPRVDLYQRMLDDAKSRLEIEEGEMEKVTAHRKFYEEELEKYTASTKSQIEKIMGGTGHGIE